MITEAGVLPTDPRAIALWHNIAALLLADKFQQEAEHQQITAYSKLLGILWTKEDVQESDTNKVKTAPPDEILMPLATIIQPELRDSIKKIFGRAQGINAPDWIRDTELVNLGDLNTPRDEFMQFVSKFVAPRVPLAPKGHGG